MKRRIVLAAALLLACGLAACHKTCVCTGYDGAEREYSEEELDARGSSCTNMVYQANVRYYSYCRWE